MGKMGPWQFNREVVYNGRDNSYTVQGSNLTVILFSNVRNRNQGVDQGMLDVSELEYIHPFLEGIQRPDEQQIQMHFS